MSFPYQIKSFEEYLEQYKISIEQPEKFWGGVAENFTWKKKWDKVLEWNFKEPRVRWFGGAKLNITENCLDRHLADGTKAADQALGLRGDHGVRHHAGRNLEIREAGGHSGGAAHVQRAEDQVARVGGADRHFGRLGIADFTHENDVRSRTEK